MRSIYFKLPCFILLSFLLSCAPDNATLESKITGSIARNFTTDPRGKLIIHNNTGLPVSLIISCFAFDSSLNAIDSDKILTGQVVIPTSTTVTYDNFIDVSNSTYAIDPWTLTTLAIPSATSITAQDANDQWAEAFDPMDPNDPKFAHWRNIRMEIFSSSSFNPTPFGGPSPAAAYGSGTSPYVGLAIELPEYVNQDSNQNIYSHRLPMNGLTQFYWMATSPGIAVTAQWHVIADSVILSNGDTDLNIYSVINGTP